MKPRKSTEVALMGLLFALVLALSFLENMISSVLLLPPGVKPGLANIVVMFCLLCKTKRQALVLVILKSGFALLTRGVLAAALSAFGGFASLLVMILLLKFMGGSSVLALSVAGAIMHNFSQLLLFSILLGGRHVWVYAPILLLAGLAAGVLTTGLLRALLPPLQRLGLADKNNKPADKA